MWRDALIYRIWQDEFATKARFITSRSIGSDHQLELQVFRVCVSSPSGQPLQLTVSRVFLS